MDGSTYRAPDEQDRQSFLWVNKTLSSKSLSNGRTGPTSSQVNSHAQKTAKRRIKQLKLGRSSTSHLVGWQKKPSPEDWQLTKRFNVGPQSLLGASRRDPFGTYPVSKPTIRFGQLLDFGKS